MGAIGPLQVLGAVLAGNIITVGWLYALVLITRRERRGQEPGFWQCMVAGVPPLIAAYGFWLMK